MLFKNLSSCLMKSSPKMSLSLVLLIPLVVQISVAVGVTGWLSFRNGQKAVNDLATRLSLEVAARTKENFRSFGDVSHLFLQMNSAAIASGNIDPGRLPQLRALFVEPDQAERSNDNHILRRRTGQIPLAQARSRKLSIYPRRIDRSKPPNLSPRQPRKSH